MARRALTERQRARKKRDRKIVRAYQSGTPAERLAARHGLSVSGIRRIIARLSGQLTEEERRRRWSAGCKAIQHDPEFRRRRSAGVRRSRSKWPECPPHLRDHYRQLVRKIPASEARAMLERDIRQGAC